MNFAPVPELLEEIRAGRMVVIVDDEDRENEGDLIMAAELVKPSDINFMVTHGRGLVCLPLTRERAGQLGLAPMVRANTAQFQTNFTVSIEAAEGVTTGISAADRAHTIRTAVRPGARPSDLHQPGHIFPLIAQPGGVLTRAGHTEAGVDLAMLAGLEPAGVLVEILNPDGTMARRPELEVFAREHGLKMGSIADLIAYRLATEHTVERVDAREIDTEFGAFTLVTYRDRIAHDLHFALVKGQPHKDTPTGPARFRRAAGAPAARAGSAPGRQGQGRGPVAPQRCRRADPRRPGPGQAARARYPAPADRPGRLRPGDRRDPATLSLRVGAGPAPCPLRPRAVRGKPRTYTVN